MTWQTLAQIMKPPQSENYTTEADYMLAETVYSNLENADQNFLDGEMGPQYASPAAYRANMTAYAKSLLQNAFAQPYAPVGWDPVAAAKAAVKVCFEALCQLPVAQGDPNTTSVYIAWTNGTGVFYGGVPPTPPPAPGTPATGQSAAPPNSIL